MLTEDQAVAKSIFYESMDTGAITHFMCVKCKCWVSPDSNVTGFFHKGTLEDPKPHAEFINQCIDCKGGTKNTVEMAQALEIKVTVVEEN
jgi:hypothetical protein